MRNKSKNDSLLSIPELRGGFTLIELLVVIAIIGILSSIVMVNLSSAKLRAANASVKSSLKSIGFAAQVIYHDLGKYNTVCIDEEINNVYKSAGTVGAGIGVCNNSSTQWAVSVPLKIEEDGNKYWCVDSSGASKSISSPLGTGRVCL
ncbi:MAG: type II secretion system protein [Candidatus Taylorbacteria bacterium]|nr:type II secretion system protein [Candidatus Taylorbacteria bacterium]